MRKYIIVVLVLVVIGVGISLLLIPNSSDVVTMQAKDIQTVDLGNVDVEAEYNQGRRSFPIISALADKRVNAGDRPAAIKLLEEYVAATPNDVQGHKKLAEQYQLAGRQADYNTQLEMIAAAEPTEANLHVLSDIYNANKDYPKQVDVLKKIVEVTKGEKPQAFVDLATMQVVIGDQDGALKTVENLKAKHPDFSSYPMTRIMVSVLAGKGEVDKAYQIAVNWMNTPNAPVPSPSAPAPATVPAENADPRPAELADLCNILHYSGHADKAIALVEPHLEMLERSPDLVVAYVQANITAGRSDHAYAILQKIDEAGRMSPQLYPPYLELAIKREDIPAAETIANKLDTAAFNEEQALNIIELARANNAETVLKTLTTRFAEPQVIEGKPVLAAVISILNNTKDQDSKIETALNTTLSSVQRIRLAESCARAKKTACFDAIVKQFPPMDEMSPAQIAEYAQLYIIADRPAELVDPVGAKAAMPNAHADVVFAYHRLAASAGRMDVMKPWLEANANTTPIAQLQELFYLAHNHHRTEVASDIAERLYARDPSPMNRDMMVMAYLDADKPEKALPLLREQIKEPGTNDGLYIATLSKLARKDASARKELGDYALVSLQSQHGDARQQINYGYVLINTGRSKDVMPFAKAYSAERGGEWKKMYAQLTQKPGTGTAAVKLTREQRIAMAQSKTISTANKRQIAFSLLNDGYKADATVIFMDLAKDKGPESQEVKDLMFMWGGKLNKDQLAWLQQRAATASPYDKSRWGDLINNGADDNAVLSYVSATPGSLYNQPLRKRYFRILASTGSRQNYDTAMRDWVAQTTDVPALSDYAATAQAYGYREAAMNGYNRVLAIDPNNPTALSQLAALNFSKGKYTEADQNLNRYLGNAQVQPAVPIESNPAQAHFYKAELLRRQGDVAGANAEYAQVVQLTMESPTTSADALSRLYTAKFRLGQHGEAKAGFEQLLASHPDDKSILADYMSALIEYHYLDDATRIANQYDKNSPYYGRHAALKGKSANVASVERFSNGREMKITFAQPIEDHSPIKIKDAQKLAWLEHSELGYDSMTISAKPGYVVRFVPTAQEQFSVVPSPMPYDAPQAETQRQQDLRLQLLYARIEQESGQPERARQRLQALSQYYPNDTQLIMSQASVESASGNTGRANELVHEAQALAPENEDYAAALRNSRRVDSPQYVKLDHEYRNYGSTDEQITTLSGVARVTRDTEMGAVLTNDFISPDAIVNPRNGAITNKSVSRQTEEVFVGHYFDSGSRAQGSIFSNNKSAGLGAYYAFNNRLGRSEVLGEYHKPYTDFPEAVYDYATRDRVGFRHYANATPTLSLGLESSLNNYNIDADSNTASSVLFRLSATQQLQAQTASQPFFGIGYGFDGEYLIDKPNGRVGVNGFYHPFQFKDREIHQLTGIYRDDWTPRTHVLFDAGWVYDRLGDNGPVVEGRINQDLTDHLEAGVRGRYSRVASNSDGDAVNLGADVMYKF